jgi:hypothetical protein
VKNFILLALAVITANEISSDKKHIMQKRLIAIILIFNLTNCMLTAQTDSTFAIKNGIGLTLSPLYSMPTNNYHNSIKDEFAGGGGLNYIFSINKKRSSYISAELGYLNNAYIISHIPNTINLVSNNGTVNYNNITYFDNIVRYNYFYFALSFQKTIFKLSKSLFLFAGIGAQTNYCYLYTSSSKDLTDANGKSADFHNNYTGNSIPEKYSGYLVAKIGLMKTISKKISFSFSPVFQYGLNPSLVFTQNNIGFNNAGVNFQLLYSF